MPGERHVDVSPSGLVSSLCPEPTARAVVDVLPPSGLKQQAITGFFRWPDAVRYRHFPRLLFLASAPCCLFARQQVGCG